MTRAAPPPPPADADLLDAALRVLTAFHDDMDRGALPPRQYTALSQLSDAMTGDRRGATATIGDLVDVGGAS